MKAAVLEEFHKPLQIRDIPVPVPGEGEALVEVMASGLCGSDLHIQDGIISSVRLPHIPGHEMAGVVRQLGPNCTQVKVGDRVVAAIDITCGICRYCRSGRPNLCRKLKRIGFERNGSHAQFIAVPEKILHQIGPDLPWEKAAVIPDAVSCMLHAVKDQAKCRVGDRMCFLGIGGLGLQGVQIARHFGAEVYCTSRQDKKLEIAASHGAHYGLNTSKVDLLQEIKRLTDGEMCDVVFDNIGIESSVQQALDIVRPGGRVIIVGYTAKNFCGNYQDVVINEKEIVGVRASNPDNLEEAIALVNQGVIDPYVFDVMPLDQINEAMERLRNGGSLGRTILLPQGG